MKSNLLQGLTVLVAEDNMINRIVMGKMLTECGVEITFAHNGSEAVKLAAIERYDVILMDLQMPETDGYEAVQQILNVKNASPNSSTPIYALTADIMEKTAKSVLASGMKGVLTKPVECDELVHVLSRHLRK